MSSGTRKALITGGAGQDGIHLARLLLDHGWQVSSTVRSEAQADRVRRYAPEAQLVHLDIRDHAAVERVVTDAAPTDVFNLAAISSVARSWQEPHQTWATNNEAVTALLDSVARSETRQGRTVRFVQASSVEVDRGSASPYAEAKSAAEKEIRCRRTEGMHAGIAILHAHESALRSLSFVSRKVTHAVAEIAMGRRERLALGNLEVARDWGAARDHVAALKAMAEADEPGDFEIGTGRTTTLRELVETAFAAAQVADPWDHVTHDAELLRPADADRIVADTRRTEQQLDWRATITFETTIEKMVAADLARAQGAPEDDLSYL